MDLDRYARRRLERIITWTDPAHWLGSKSKFEKLGRPRMLSPWFGQILEETFDEIEGFCGARFDYVGAGRASIEAYAVPVLPAALGSINGHAVHIHPGRTVLLFRSPVASNGANFSEAIARHEVFHALVRGPDDDEHLPSGARSVMVAGSLGSKDKDVYPDSFLEDDVAIFQHLWGAKT